MNASEITTLVNSASAAAIIAAVIFFVVCCIAAVAIEFFGRRAHKRMQAETAAQTAAVIARIRALV